MSHTMNTNLNNHADPALEAALDALASEDIAAAPAGLESRIAHATQPMLSANMPPATLRLSPAPSATRGQPLLSRTFGLRLAASLAIVGTIIAAIVASRHGPAAPNDGSPAPIAVTQDPFDPLSDEFLAFAWGDSSESSIDSIRAAAEQLGQRLEGDFWGISDLLSEEGST